MSVANISKRSEEIPIIQKSKKLVKGKMSNMTKVIKKIRTRSPSSKKDDTHYVDNKQFLKAFIEYNAKYTEAKKNGLPAPQIPDYIGHCFIKIAQKFSNHKSFIGYPYKDEMIADAIENCVMYAYDFDPNRGTNPFAYFTTVVWHAFVRRINKENKNKYIVYKSHQMKSFLYEGESGFSENAAVGAPTTASFYRATDSSVGDPAVSKELYDNITSYIDDYERKIKEKKAKKKPKKTQKVQK